MKNLDMLFVRACKTLEPEKRVRSVYRRFYGKYLNPEVDIANILAKICDEYLNISNIEMINMMSPENTWIYHHNGDGDVPPYYTLIL